MSHQSRDIERKQYNNILRAAYAAGRLIIREQKKESLLHGVCSILVNTQAVQGAWIGLIEAKNDHSVSFSGQDGFNSGTNPRDNRIKPVRISECLKKLSGKNILLIENPSERCTGCPVYPDGRDSNQIIAELADDGHHFGVICVSGPKRIRWRDESVSLFLQLVEDIGVALHRLETKAAPGRCSCLQANSRPIDLTGDGIITVDPNGMICLFNRGAERILDCSAREAIGRSIIKFCPDDQQNLHRQMLQKAIKGETVGGFETSLQTLNGKRVSVEIALSLHVDETGLATGITGVVRDITERKEAQRKLLESEQNYRALFENAPTGIFRTDSTGKPLLINTSLARFLKLDSTKQISRYTDLTNQHYVEPKRRTEFIKKLKRHGFVENFEYRARTTDDQFIWLSMNARASKIAKDGTFTIDGFLTDITERKKASQERERLMMAIEQAAEVIMITDTKGIIQYANPALERITCYAKEEVLGHHLSMFRSGKHNESFYETIWDTLRRAEVWSGRIINRKKDGTVFTGEGVISPVRDANGNVVNFVTVSRDITREIQLEKQLRQSEKMEAIGVLAGGISHDFNNILGGIIGYAELSRWEVSDHTPVAEYLDRILEAADRARKLVGQILTFSRQDSDRKSAHYINPIIAEVIQLLRAAIPTSIEITADLCDETQPVLADTTHIHEIILNLCTNAAHSIGEKGLLKISLSEQSFQNELVGRIGKSQAGRYSVISISDTGCGMDEEIIQRIFEPFFTTKQAGEGTGMGLAVVFGIVKNHQGNITVESTPGGGTTFRVYLPKFFGHTDSPSESAQPHIEGGNERILVVDDEKIIREAIGDFLSRLGYSVTVFGESRKALEAFRQNPESFDLVLTDQTMPSMSGLQLARELRSIGKIPVILCSGYSKYVDKQEAPEKGVKAYLQKPFRLKELAQTIRLALKDD